MKRLVVLPVLLLIFLVGNAGVQKPSPDNTNAGGPIYDRWGQAIDLGKLPPSVNRPVDFSNEVKPILESSCLNCHGPQSPGSGFRLDNRKDALKGGRFGVDIFPGASFKSPLIHYVASLVDGMEMPPQGHGEPLTERQIGLLRAWVDQGVPWTDERAPDATSAEKATAGGEKPNMTAALPPPLKRVIDFVNDVRPILASRCYSCHGANKQSDGLRWDVRELAFQGGISGPTILPGHSAKSRIIQFVSGIPADKLMPRAGDRLTDEEIGLLRAWIDQGAQWPEDYDPKKYSPSQGHWAYRPLVSPHLPTVKDKSWPRTPIDHFILAKLEEKGLKPSPPADKRTLFRRVTLNLTGLQPTPEEYRDFLGDDSPGAYARVVGRLLASPRYGERWARHWMDVVHYADSQGHDQDRPRENSWPYRDYLIRSFNQDKAYARFLEEQLAGDVLYPDDPAGIIATGFIVAGPFDESSMIFIVDDTLDKKQAQNLDRDDMLMTTMSTFLSTTVHCARCHDHKFDPISQTEYYNLQSVFAGIDRADRPYDPDPKIHLVRQPLLKKKMALEVKQKFLSDRVAATKNPEIDTLDVRIESLNTDLEGRAKLTDDETSPTLGYQSEVSPSTEKPKWVQVELEKSMPIDQIILVPVHLPDDPGFGFPARFRVDISNDASFTSFQTVADHSEADFHNPGATPYGIQIRGQMTHYIRVTALPAPAGVDYWLLALAELLAYAGAKNVAFGAKVTASDSTESQPEKFEIQPKWSRANLVNGYTSLVSLEYLGLAKESPKNGYLSEIASSSLTEKWVQVNLGKPIPIEQIRLLPAHPKENPDAPGFGFPLRFKIESFNQTDFTKRQALIDHVHLDFSNPGDRPVEFSGEFAPAQFVRVTATRLGPVTDGYAFALAELQIYSDGENVAAGAVVLALDSLDNDLWSKKALVDNYTSRLGIGEPVTAVKSAGRAGEIELQIEKLSVEREALVFSLADPALHAELDNLDQKLAEVKRQLAALPPSQMVYAATADFAPFNKFKPTKGIPRPVHRLGRGEITNSGELAIPGALSLVPGLDAHFDLEDPKDEAGRRAALAKWITSPKNVLTWRSIVNRIWHYQFGRGLVDTPNDFGHIASPPSHPELLDWLAVWFLENGSSMKKLHKMILTSSVYLQSSQDHPEFSKMDAENRYLWRMNRRRLDAESIRDSVLQASGKLDLTMGGPPVKPFDYQAPNPGATPLINYKTFDVDNPANFRRSVYRWVFRTRPDPFMEVLDSPDASELAATRNVSTTALQALAMWNNSFMVKQSEHLAARVAKEEAGSDLGAQITAAYWRVLCRPPTASETKDLVAYAARHGMANACRLIFNTNEYTFVN